MLRQRRSAAATALGVTVAAGLIGGFSVAHAETTAVLKADSTVWCSEACKVGTADIAVGTTTPSGSLQAVITPICSAEVATADPAVTLSALKFSINDVGMSGVWLTDPTNVELIVDGTLALFDLATVPHC